jgi:predicted nuclease of restriction endonuclease-like (RecB) superfamily
MSGKSLLAARYAALLAEVKQRVRAAQIKAAVSANRELILLYWDIGRAIVQAQKDKGYGKQVVEMLSTDLRREFPEMAGFTARNLWFMRAFFLAYADGKQILKQPVSESLREWSPGVSSSKLKQSVSETTSLSQAVTESADKVLSRRAGKIAEQPPAPLLALPWGHNIALLQKIKDPATRLWYAQTALEHGWSRNVLTLQIESRLHRRQGKAITNFSLTLPAPQSDLARQTLKDPYIFDFLTLDAAARERELELGLLEHIQKFLIELGVGFAFVGRQYRLKVSGEEFALDLLFYHLGLRCFVVVDLKMEAFKPEFAGKINFYLSAVDDQLRRADDQPTIGLLLCKERNRLIVEYALRDVKKPIGVAEWRTRLVESLPKKLQSSLPTVAQIEAELEVELQPIKIKSSATVSRSRKR